MIGISGYRNVPPLPPFVIRDAQEVYEVLRDPGLCGYRHGEFLVDTGTPATRAGILGALQALAARTSRDSTVFIYLSGHAGHLASGNRAEEYVLAIDTVADTMESLAQTAISGDELSRALQAIPARRVAIVLDCRHAGATSWPRATGAADLRPGLPERYYESLRSGQGRAVLAACRSDEASYPAPDAGTSLFALHLLAGLRGAAPSHDGLIRIFDLFEYLQPRVVEDAFALEGVGATMPAQHPLLRSDLEDDFAVGLYLGGRRGMVFGDVDGFRHHAYVSYVDQGQDATWVWERLRPRLEGSGLRVAVSGDAWLPGMALVVNIERGITQARRTVVVLSPAYLHDAVAEFEAAIARHIGITQRAARLLPVKIAELDDTELPLGLDALETLDFTDRRRADREFDRLLAALRAPLAGPATATRRRG